VSGSKPKKRFSQNFLADKNIAAAIVDLLEIQNTDVVFEIGSGRGTLTEIIAKSADWLYTFEIDRMLIDPLERKFKRYDNVEIVNVDFLKVRPADYHSGHFKLIGNIPYDITSPLLSWMTKYRHNISLAAITIQKEMAERLCSQPGNKSWAPISIFARCFFKIKNVMTIPPDAFYPRPKIYSATLVFTPKESYEIENRKHFEDVVRLAFKHRRKYLTNNLSEIPGLDKTQLENILHKIGLNNKVRAEQLSIDNFILLSKEIKSSGLT